LTKLLLGSVDILQRYHFNISDLEKGVVYDAQSQRPGMKWVVSVFCCVFVRAIMRVYLQYASR